MDQLEQYELIIELMAEKIQDMKDDAAMRNSSHDYWVDRVGELQLEVFKLREANKPKRGRPPKKRGPGRPKKVKK
jgi:Mg2+ and Co2+ transporter CorA